MYISQDPIGLAGGNPTLYGYVCDPNSWVDELGLRCNPVSKLSDRDFVQRIAEKAERWGIRKGYGPTGSGHVQGSAKHAYAEKLMKRYQSITGQRKHLEIEQSYLNGRQVQRGTSGSARPDVYNPQTGEVFDYKFTRDSSSPISASQQAKNANNLPTVSSQTAIHP